MSSIQVLSFQLSGIKLGTFKSINESLTRVAVYISLISLYCLGGSKVKAVSKSILCDHIHLSLIILLQGFSIIEIIQSS
jgi:hypothetical protein